MNVPRNLIFVLLAALGGVLGASLRAGLLTVIPSPDRGFPWVIFLINMVGSFILGILIQGLTQGELDERKSKQIRLFFGTGILGGFTTYSTFVLQIHDQIASDQVVLALSYLLLSLVLGVFCAAAGVLTASTAMSRKWRANGQKGR